MMIWYIKVALHVFQILPLPVSLLVLIFKKILSDPQFSTIIITAYDGTSFGNCGTKNYLDPNFYTTQNTTKIEAEYRDLASYLKTFNKKFIISNWESDNDAYCGSGYYSPETCVGGADHITALTKWFQARTNGIHSAGTTNVFSGIEFNIVHSPQG